MNAHEQAASHVIFGWDPIWVSCILFVLTYAVIVSERVNRAIVALVGAGLMVSLGVLNQETAIRGVDFNTLGPADRNDGARGHHPAQRRVPVHRDLVGQAGAWPVPGPSW